ncbi:hypothetical protein Tco_1235960 [Tanacetum coccineum]
MNEASMTSKTLGSFIRALLGGAPCGPMRMLGLKRLHGFLEVTTALFLQNILELYFKYFKLPEDVVNRILQVVLDLQHFKSSLVIFAATILQGLSSIHHNCNI